MPEGTFGNGINLSRFQVPTGENASPPGNYFIRRNTNGSGNAAAGGSSTNANQQAESNIEMMLGNLMRNFSELFSGHQFLRMNQMFSGFSPDQFMTNFNSNF